MTELRLNQRKHMWVVFLLFFAFQNQDMAFATESEKLEPLVVPESLTEVLDSAPQSGTIRYLRMRIERFQEEANEEATIWELSQWLFFFQRDSKGMRRTPANKELFEAVDEFLLARFDQVVAFHMEDFLAKIEEARNSEHLARIVDPVLSHYPDQSRGSARVITEAVANKLGRSKAEDDERRFSAQEREMMVEGTTTIQVPADPPEPSADSMRLAMLRALAANALGGEMISSTEVKFKTTTTSIMGAYGVLSITQLTKVAGPDGKTFTKNPDGSYTCYYQDVQMGVAAFGKEGIEIANTITGLSEAAIRRELSQKVSSDTFILEETGWYSPSYGRGAMIESLAR